MRTEQTRSNRRVCRRMEGGGGRGGKGALQITDAWRMRVNYEKCLLNSNILCGNGNDSWLGFWLQESAPPLPSPSPSPPVSYCVSAFQHSTAGIFPLQPVMLQCWHCGTVSNNDNYARTMIKLIMTSNAIVSRADIICELLTSDTHTRTQTNSHGHRQQRITCQQCLTPSTCQLPRATCHVASASGKFHLKVHSALLLNSFSLGFEIPRCTTWKLRQFWNMLCIHGINTVN